MDTADASITSSTSYDYLGFTVASAGDINGDGNADFAGAGPYATSSAGQVWIFEGPVGSGAYEADDLAVATITNTTYGYIGQSMVYGGDVNADGYDDLIVGKYYNPGAAYVILGPVEGESNIDTVAGAAWTEEVIYDYAGWSVGGGFDFNDDGYDDYAIGAPYAETGSTYSTGATYLVYGPGLVTASIADADAKIGATTSYEYMGWSTTGLGDVDGDGTDDFATSAYASNSYSGRTYVFTGGTLEGDFTADAEATAYFQGAATYDYLGYKIANGGDFNNDGYADLLAFAMYADTGAPSSGSAYVIEGPMIASGSIATYADAELYGEASSDAAGFAMDGAMDLNRDGYTDVLVGAPYWEDGTAGMYSQGATYLMYGPQTGAVALADARCRMTGTAYNDNEGYGVAFIGDQDGDTSPEILSGAPYSNEGSSYGGALHLIFGGRL
jgi:hypothetical protein